MSTASLVMLGSMAVAGELVDSSLGMMYGTLLSPILILMGYDPKIVVPSIVISQAVGGGIAAFRHHRYNNVNFNGMTKDMKIALAIIIPGTIAAIAGAFVGQTIPRFTLKMYIGILVTIMGILCLRPIFYGFSWRKMWGIGTLSGFNKALSGGGFGPVTSTGKILGGVNPKVSIGTTTLSEVPICIASFITWRILGGSIPWQFPAVLCIGAFTGGMIGPRITKNFDSKPLRRIVGWLALASGIWVITALFVSF